jgi:hypothetical protein
MDSPVPPPQHHLRSVVLAALLGLALPGCGGPAVRTASFRLRPDSIEAGDLRGPFTGKVVDATSGQPVAGALVHASWSFESGYGFNTPAGHREYITSTDASGTYRIPALGRLPRDRRLSDFYLVVYKRGYVGYRSDRRFADLGARLDFSQKQNQVLLERWRADFSHARHLRFLGGGPALAALTAWEVRDAVAELGGAGQAMEPRMATDPFGRRGSATVVAAQLLTQRDIKQLTGFDGEFETGPLGDEPDTRTYSSQHFKALNLPERYDIALRLWKLTGPAARERYAELVDSLPGADRRNEIASESLRAEEGDIFGVAFLDAERGVVALLTCGRAQCASSSVAVALARSAHRSLVRQWPTAGKNGAASGPLRSLPPQTPPAPPQTPPATGAAQPTGSGATPTGTGTSGDAAAPPAAGEPAEPEKTPAPSGERP